LVYANGAFGTNAGQCTHFTVEKYLYPQPQIGKGKVGLWAAVIKSR